MIFIMYTYQIVAKMIAEPPDNDINQLIRD
jgi:hypothetical protein